MDRQETAATLAWVQRWAHVSAELRALDADQDPDVTLADVIPQFNEALRAALLMNPPEPYSGLIELQAILARARR
jgi:hypothetical protein